MTMARQLSLGGVLLAFATWFPAEAFASGDLQILCPPGVTVYIDGNFKGVTNSNEEGLFIEGLSAGSHTLKAVLKGFRSQTENFSIWSGRLTEIRLQFVKQNEQVRSLESSDSAVLQRETGSLKLTAVPPRPKATVKLDGVYKGEGAMEVSGLATGSHRVTWTRKGETMSYNTGVEAGCTTSLKADFRTGQVTVDSPCASGGSVGTSTDAKMVEQAEAQRVEKARLEAMKTWDGCRRACKQLAEEKGSRYIEVHVGRIGDCWCTTKSSPAAHAFTRCLN